VLLVKAEGVLRCRHGSVRWNGAPIHFTEMGHDVQEGKPVILEKFNLMAFQL
jgi:hypothetical protein